MLKPCLRELGFIFISALLLRLISPTYDLNVLAWIALVPLIISIERRSLFMAFFLSYSTGLLFFAAVFYWIWTVTAFNLFDFLLLDAYLAFYFGLWGVGFNWFSRNIRIPSPFIAASLWVTIEYFRSHFSFLSLPLILLGHSQYSRISLIQISSITGVYGVSFLIVLVNATIAGIILLLSKKNKRSIRALTFDRDVRISVTTVLFLLIITYSYGLYVVKTGFHHENISVAMLHGDISQDYKWDIFSRRTIIDHYADQTRKAVQSSPSLVIWPETAVPGDIRHTPELLNRISSLVVETKTYHLIGNSENGKFTNRKYANRFYNNMVLLSPDGKVEGQYRKIKLLPFGEYIPLRNTLKWPKALVPEMEDNLAGNDYTLLKVGRAVFGTTICWEVLFPELFSEFVKRGAHFMVNATDESWFKKTDAISQLFIASIFRAVENRIAIARVTNMGVSAFIDPFGHIMDLPNVNGNKNIPGDDVLIANVPLSGGGTFYTRYGDVFALLQIGICAIVLAYTVRVRWKMRPVIFNRKMKGGYL